LRCKIRYLSRAIRPVREATFYTQSREEVPGGLTRKSRLCCSPAAAILILLFSRLRVDKILKAGEDPQETEALTLETSLCFLSLLLTTCTNRISLGKMTFQLTDCELPEPCIPMIPATYAGTQTRSCLTGTEADPRTIRMDPHRKNSVRSFQADPRISDQAG
jgi:hypothetical protein